MCHIYPMDTAIIMCTVAQHQTISTRSGMRMRLSRRKRRCRGRNLPNTIAIACTRSHV
jgi:hypothetical protein